MWKTCQAFRAQYESVVAHSTPLPSLYPQRYLAGFRAGLGILTIGGKKRNFPCCPESETAKASLARGFLLLPDAERRILNTEECEKQEASNERGPSEEPLSAADLPQP